MSSAQQLLETDMTATMPAPTAQTALRPAEAAPSTSLRRRGIGIAIVAGAAVSIAGFATTVWEKSDKKIDYLNSLDVHPLQSQLAAMLLHFGYMLFVPTLIALGVMTRARRSRVASIGLGIGYLGAVALPGALVTDFYDLAIRQTLPDGTAVQVSDKAGSYPIAAIMMVPTVLALMVGLVIGLVAAARAHWLPWYLAPVFAVGFLAPVALQGQGWVANVVPAAVALSALAFVGVRVLRMSDREYATGLHG
jgi:hypothetical protein